MTMTLGNANSFQQQTDALREAMKAQNLDVLVAVSPENVIYSSGAIIWSQRSIPHRLAMTVIDKSGKTAMVVCSIEEGIAREQTWIEPIWTYVEGTTHPIDLLHAVLESFGRTTGRVGIEGHYLTMALGQHLDRRLNKYELVFVDDLFDQVRFIKQPSELEKLASAAKATQAAVAAALKKFTVGMTELELYRLLCSELLESGSDQVVSLTCCSGVRTTILHAHPKATPIQAGTLIKIDIHGTYKGYRSDIARIAYAGEPSAVQADAFRRFWALHRTILALPRPGITVDMLMGEIESSYSDFGFTYNVPHMGHSFGVGLHEEPLLVFGDHTVLENGTVLSIEPRAQWCQDERYHLEDPVAVTAQGSSVLTADETPDQYLGVG